ncbi:MAG: iron-containing alcohol dehydrogenase [Clostridiales bacterium]|nr:iron-containing alcohol dehydrogenase [Clostridiales bacterium]
MDDFSKKLIADSRMILTGAEIHHLEDFSQLMSKFDLDSRDVVLTNRFIYQPFMEEFKAPCNFVFQEDFGTSEPSEDMIEKLFDFIKYDSYDRVIAIGGGAIMDLGKLLGCHRPGNVHEWFYKREPVVHEKPVIAVPTTCGTGSEVTNISVAIVKSELEGGVLTDGETKLGLVSDDIIPNIVVLIPEFLSTLPYKPFITSAIDALVHATESYLSPQRKTLISEMYSMRAMELLLVGLKKIAEEGQEARKDYLKEFLVGANLAGTAFLKAGCGTVHALSFPLGGTYHVPHGESNYALFGKILEIYEEYDPEGELLNFKKLVSGILGCSIETAIPALNELLEKVCPLKPLREYGFKETDIDAFADSVEANQQRLITNSYVQPWTKELSKRVYGECF